MILEATIAEFIGHIIGNIALPAYYLRREEFSWLKHVALPTGSIIIILFGIFYTFYPVSSPIIYAPVFMIIILVISAYWHYERTKKNGTDVSNQGIESLAIEAGLSGRE